MARCVTDVLRKRGVPVSVHSTDEFFMPEGRYVFVTDFHVIRTH